MKFSNTDSNVLASRPAVRYTSNTRSIERTFDRTPYTLRSTVMSVALAEPVAPAVVERPRALRLVPAGPEVEPAATPTRTRPRRTGPGVGPAARPRQLRFAAPPAARAQGCRVVPPVAVAAAAPASAPSWRLTERGVAVVLAVAAALVVASVVVVGLTALRVTGDGYRASHASDAVVAAQA